MYHLCVKDRKEVAEMAQYSVERKSHCLVCGKRLSEKKQVGNVQWQPCQVDDKGIYCVTCYKPKKKNSIRKSLFL
jgi:hypothetical protein